MRMANETGNELRQRLKSLQCGGDLFAQRDLVGDALLFLAPWTCTYQWILRTAVFINQRLAFRTCHHESICNI
jgi:hypothetical protein